MESGGRDEAELEDVDSDVLSHEMVRYRRADGAEFTFIFCIRFDDFNFLDTLVRMP